MVAVFNEKKRYAFSKDEFYKDVGRGPIKGDWVLKIDGREIDEFRKKRKNTVNYDLGRVKGTYYWVFPEWCKEI
ncbi:hypothetical protein ACR75P_05100 [Faecalicoccus pleomorphus]|uniref:hypothetical protein n=1 Tax=Faecalicoccus pleomorphus TaxID=1323 RepID=UPI003DA278DD